MKLVVLAHTPPPMHGQSYMVQLMLEGFGGDRRRQKKPVPPSPHGIECFHVNARVSKNLEDIGGIRFAKLFLLLWHCFQAVWCRFRYGATTLYYVPAPGKTAALYRDWLVMWFCRPFFEKVVFHWHATSLARWLETSTTLATRGVTFRLLGEADLSIVLSEYNRFNAEKLWPRQISVVPNGIPDPCPNFAARILPRRQARVLARKRVLAGEELSPADNSLCGSEPEVVRVLFLSHCTHEKGLFDAVEAVLLANQKLRAQKSGLSFQLTVGGIFPNPQEKKRFDEICLANPGSIIHYAGFLQGEQKEKAMCQADLLCFPSHWESFGLVLVEAMAFGLPIVTTRCGAVPDVMPADYPGLADVKSPEQVASILITLATYDKFAALRDHFRTRFTLEKFFTSLARALHELNSNGDLRSTVTPGRPEASPRLVGAPPP